MQESGWGTGTVVAQNNRDCKIILYPRVAFLFIPIDSMLCEIAADTVDLHVSIYIFY